MFLEDWRFGTQKPSGAVRAKYLRRARITACRRGRLEATGAEGTNGGHAVDDGLRLLEARGDRLSGSVMEQEADGKDSAERIPVFWATSSVLHCGMLNL